MNAADVLWVLFDMILLVLFGSTLSSIISFPLTTQGQLSAVGTIVSAGYGFICGAYMPISNFGSGLQKALSYLPSTYATSLIKNHNANHLIYTYHISMKSQIAIKSFSYRFNQIRRRETTITTKQNRDFRIVMQIFTQYRL